MQSDNLAERIDEARALIVVQEAALARLPAEMEKLLAGEEIDSAGLRVLEEKGSGLRREIGYLTTRVTLLEKQREVAERQEGAHRLLEIARESVGLAQQSEEVASRFRTDLGTMLQLVEEFRVLLKQRAVLGEEAEYCRVKHELPWPSLAQVSAPKMDDLRPLVVALESLLRPSVPNTDWSREAEKIKRERERAARLQPRSSTPSVDDNSPSREELFRRAYAERAKGCEASEPRNEKSPGWSITKPGAA